ncbi:ankyrin repeat domain-containing protein [Flavobacterium laiguense]|nr:ankyrin repeat domain-containing protein [Flavobacterium laiguense]
MTQTMNIENDILEFIKTGQNDKLELALKENPLLMDSKTEQGISYLQFAAYCRNKIAVDLLRQHKQQLDIFESASTGDIYNLKKRLEEDSNLLNSYSIDGFTPLGLSCFFGHYSIVKYLIERGANVNIPSNNQFKVAPIHSACAISNYDITELLLKNGADVNAKQLQGVTPLHSAAHNGQTKLAKLLIESGSDINAKMDNGQTPLFIANEKNFTETTSLLKQYGGQ